MARAFATAAGDRPLHAYGEMVALLWERGEVAAALELESMWNAVIAGRPVRLLCAYPAGELAAADLGDVARLCGLHDRVSLAGPHPGAGATARVGDVVWSSVHLPVPAAVGSVRRFVRDALTGWGLSRFQSYQVAEPIAAGRLIPVLTDYEREPVPIHIVHAEGRDSSARLRIFVDYAATRLRADRRLHVDARDPEYSA